MAKLIVQELWKLGLEWDENVPANLANQWQNFKNDLLEITNINVPRQAIISDYIQIEMHGFSDASEKAYGAAVYIRVVTSSGKIYCNLLCGKSRVAPVKQISLPRLELCGALLLANLTNKIRSVLNIEFNKYWFWTDSMIVLAWIKGPPCKWKTFVANRVSEIQSLTNISDWFHVSSGDNLSRSFITGSIRECFKKLHVMVEWA